MSKLKKICIYIMTYSIVLRILHFYLHFEIKYSLLFSIPITLVILVVFSKGMKESLDEIEEQKEKYDKVKKYIKGISKDIKNEKFKNIFDNIIEKTLDYNYKDNILLDIYISSDFNNIISSMDINNLNILNNMFKKHKIIASFYKESYKEIVGFMSLFSNMAIPILIGLFTLIQNDWLFTDYYDIKLIILIVSIILIILILFSFISWDLDKRSSNYSNLIDKFLSILDYFEVCISEEINKRNNRENIDNCEQNEENIIFSQICNINGEDYLINITKIL